MTSERELRHSGPLLSLTLNSKVFFSVLFQQFQNVSSSTKFRYCDGNYYWLFTRFI